MTFLKSMEQNNLSSNLSLMAFEAFSHILEGVFTPVVQFIWSISAGELRLICIFPLVWFGLVSHRQKFLAN